MLDIFIIYMRIIFNIIFLTYDILYNFKKENPRFEGEYVFLLCDCDVKCEPITTASYSTISQ